MRYNKKIVHFSLVPLLFFFSGSATADTYPFSVNPTFGDRDIFNFTVNSVGTINGEATWTGSAANLALILNGPGQVGYYARKDGSSPLSLSYTVTTADLSKGTDWRLSIVNFGGGDATGTVTIAYPIEPTYLYIHIDIDSTPQGAQIWIDGVNSGELTPSTQYFDRPGEHTIELILNGYQLYQDSFDSSKSMKLKVNLTPIVKPTPTPSFYFIDSTPRGAQVWIDGVNSGELTPFRKYFDKPGEHTIELILNGYQPYQDSFDSSKSMIRKVNLTPIVKPTPAPSIYIDIDSTPQGAQIWIDGVNSGELTPFRKYFDRPGEHTIELILNGYQPYQDSFDSSKSMILQVNLTPIVKAASSIYIDINSTPQGAQIWIDGVNSGELTPFIKYFDKPGEHTIELILNGYQPYQESFYISESMTKKVNLTPIVKPTPTPSIYIIDSTPRGAQIWIDGVNSGELTPFIKYFDKPGEHTIELILNGYQPYQDSFYISGLMTIKVNLIPIVKPAPYIYIDIDSTPRGAQIWIDGVNSGELTPFRKYFDRPGAHTIELILNGYQPYQESFYISESMTKKVTLKSPQKSTPTTAPDSTHTRFPTPGFPVRSLMIAIFFVYFFIFKDKVS